MVLPPFYLPESLYLYLLTITYPHLSALSSNPSYSSLPTHLSSREEDNDIVSDFTHLSLLSTPTQAPYLGYAIIQAPHHCRPINQPIKTPHGRCIRTQVSLAPLARNPVYACAVAGPRHLRPAPTGDEGAKLRKPAPSSLSRRTVLHAYSTAVWAVRYE
jgi:hypothetical protein